ncbi:MAG: type II toxin-antitoxin system RelE/ParE family toxin, partial [Dehalococcoidia bacterium]
FPESGRVVPELNVHELREVVVKPYRVVYRYRAGVVEIVTVFRASRLPPPIE